MEAYMTAQDPTVWDKAQAEARATREEKAAAEAENLDELDEEDEVMTSGKRKRSVSEKKDKKKRERTGKKVSMIVEIGGQKNCTAC